MGAINVEVMVLRTGSYENKSGKCIVESLLHHGIRMYINSIKPQTNKLIFLYYQCQYENSSRPGVTSLISLIRSCQLSVIGLIPAYQNHHGDFCHFLGSFTGQL